MNKNLDELSKTWGSDKHVHGFTKFYEPFFEAKARDWYDSLERHTALVYQRRGIYDPMSKTWFSGKYASYYDIGVLSGGIGEHDIKSVKDRQYVEHLEEAME